MTDADLHAARQTDLNIAFAKSDWKERKMMPSEPTISYDTSSPQAPAIRAWIEYANDLRAKLEDTREALHRFGKHDRTCAYVGGGFCDCGLHAAKDAK